MVEAVILWLLCIVLFRSFKPTLLLLSMKVCLASYDWEGHLCIHEHFVCKALLLSGALVPDWDF